MRLTNVKEINEFIGIVPECKGDVIVKSVEGDVFNLKSSLSQYIAIGRLIEDRGSDLELFCTDKADEARFLKFFFDHPDAV